MDDEIEELLDFIDDWLVEKCQEKLNQRERMIFKNIISQKFNIKNDLSINIRQKLLTYITRKFPLKFNSSSIIVGLLIILTTYGMATKPLPQWFDVSLWRKLSNLANKTVTIYNFRQVLLPLLEERRTQLQQLKSDNQNIFPILFAPDEIPFSLFCQLIEAGLPLQIEDYKLLLEILSNPANIANLDLKIDNYEQFYQLCKSLWVKSPEQKRIFQQVCQQFSQTDITDIFPNSLATDTPTTISQPVLVNTPNINPTDTATPDEISSPQIDLTKIADQPTALDLPNIPRLKEPNQQPNCFRLTKLYQHYRPVSPLEMQQTWHQLNYQYLGNIPTEIDLIATINDVSKNANLFDIHLKPPELPKTQLILLIDRPGSMIPFHRIERQLQKTISIGGRLDDVTTYYFINSPIFLYTDAQCEHHINLSQILSQAHSQHTLLLIFSDAGAARGRNTNLTRVKSTKEFYNYICPYFRAIAWLNPMPKQRWKGTSACEIAKFIKMFACNQQDFSQALKFLTQKITNTNPLGNQ